MQKPCKYFEMFYFIKLNLINELRQGDRITVKMGAPLIGVSISQLTKIW